METRQIIFDKPISAAGMNILPIAQVRRCVWPDGRSSFWTKQPLYVIVRGTLASKAFRMNGDELTLDQLRTECPEAAAPLEGP
jgi:hypothetical protein